MSFFNSLAIKGVIGISAVATPVALGNLFWKRSSSSAKEFGSINHENIKTVEEIQVQTEKKTEKQELEEVDNLLLAEIDKFKSWSKNEDNVKIQKNEGNQNIDLKVSITNDTNSSYFTHQISFEPENEDDNLIGSYKEWNCNIQWSSKIEVNDLKKELLGISENSGIDKEKMKKTVRICSERREKNSDDYESQIHRDIKISSYEGEDADDIWFNNFFKNKTPEQK